MKKVKVADDETILITDYSQVRGWLGISNVFENKISYSQTSYQWSSCNSKVNVKGTLILKNPTTLSGQEIPFQIGQLCDETGTIKIVLWREYTGMVSNASYAFLALMKSSYGNEPQLQSISWTSSASIPFMEHEVLLDTPLHVVESNILCANYTSKCRCIQCKEEVKMTQSKRINCSACGTLWRAIPEIIIFAGNVKKSVGLHEVYVG